MTVKNYAEQGGDQWVVSGILEITGEGQLSLNGIPLTSAAFQEDSTAATIAELKADLNALLAKLRVAGLMDQNHG